MRRPSLLRATTSDSEGPSQRQIWLFRLAKFLLVLTFVEDGLTHGIGSYAAKLGGHKRHRDALMFVGAQDLSVLAALLLLAATGPGGISVDAKYGKGN